MDTRPKAPGDPRDTARPTARRSQPPASKPPAASSRPQPKHGWSRDRFCDYLRAQRERASLSIEDIARVTKIPERSLRQLEESLALETFAQNMAMEYRIGGRVLVLPDFAEGVRAVIVDKDHAPKWHPARPEGVTEEMLEAIFAPLPPEEEWKPL